MIVTFYSYKGGVGRSMALANVACRLANKHGMTVLVIDWDLEAPGLHFYFGYKDEELRKRNGLIDLLYKLNSKGQAEYDLGDYLIDPTKSVKDRIQFGQVRIMSCGRLRSNYMRRVAEFNWSKFYSESDAFLKLEALKQKILSQFDICLIDSRAGQSEINITPTSHMPDAVALLFTSNQQSVSGTDEVARRIYNSRADQSLPTISQILVPSRVFPKQPGFIDWFARVVQPAYELLSRDGILGKSNQLDTLSSVILPVDASSSFGETLPILESDKTSSPLIEGYIALTEQIAALRNSSDLLWRPDRLWGYGPISETRVLEIRSELEEAAKRGDEYGAAFARLSLARYLRVFGRLEEAKTLALASFTFSRGREDRRSLQALAQHELGQIAYAQRMYADAIGYYNEALAVLDPGQDIPKGIILHDLAVVHAAAGQFDEAVRKLETSLEIKRQLGDIRGQAMSVHQRGNIEFSRRNLEEAAMHFKRAAELARQANDNAGVAISLHQLGNLRAATDPEGALEYFRQALSIHAGNVNLRGQAITQRRIADVMASQGHLSEAQSGYISALSLAYHAGDKRNALTIHRRLGELLRSAGRFGESRGELAAALRLSHELRLSRESFLSYLSIARTELAARNVAAAQLAIELAEREFEAQPSDRNRERLEEVKSVLADIVRTAG